jgi:hypothetical protein
MATPTQVMEIFNRLTALDGIGSPVPSQMAVPTIDLDLNGLHTTINQLTLTIQAQLNTVAQQLQTLQGTVNTLLGGTGGLNFGVLPVYPNNATAVAAGLKPGAVYRTGADPDVVCVVH